MSTRTGAPLAQLPPDLVPADEAAGYQIQRAVHDLLLPQTGSLATAGVAVRDGVLAAYYAETRSKPGIRVYDTQSTAAGAGAAYLKAVNEGAQMIIGPIGKDETAAVAAQLDGIPLLALNAVDAPNPASSINTSRTLGAPEGGVGCPIRSQSGCEPSSVRCGAMGMRISCS